MKLFSTLLIFFFGFLIFEIGIVSAQCNPNGCTFPDPQVNPMDACVLPDLAALNCYAGSTNAQSSVAFPVWCGDNSSNQWFAFTAEATTVSTFIQVVSCSQGICKNQHRGCNHP